MKKYQDHYFKKAKRENYPARSVYKLQEIDAKFRLFSRGLSVLDLGAAPGSWSLLAAEKVGATGQVLAVDLQATDTVFPAQVRFFQEDILQPSPELNEALDQVGPFDIVVSDMAPRTSGIKFADQARSLELAEAALDIAVTRLKPGGHFVVKIFYGPDVQAFVARMRGHFTSVKTYKPQSSRSESKETFLIGLEHTIEPQEDSSRRK